VSASTQTVAEMIVTALAELGVRTAWGVVGDALNPVTDAIRREDRIEWVGVRHEEVGAFAAGAQAQLTDSLGLCLGTVGPGSVHLLNGLYDARKSHAPVLAICGQVPLADLGSDYFQEVDNDVLFRDVAAFARTVTAPQQARMLLEQAVQAALDTPGVAVLTLPGDVAGMELPKGIGPPRFVRATMPTEPDPTVLSRVAEVINEADRVTMLVGIGARAARTEVLAVAEALSAPMVLTLKAKDGLERENPYQVGQSGLLGNPTAHQALDDAEVLLMVGTDFPYREWYPDDATVIQIDTRPEHIGRRTPVDLGVVGDAGASLSALQPLLNRKSEPKHLEAARESYLKWQRRQVGLLDPDHDRGMLGRLRERVDNTDDRIRPELLAATVDRLAGPEAVFSTDTGMSTVWMSRFVTLSGRRRLIGSFNLGSMANAMPQALGAQALDRQRQVIAFCGDGGLSMLLGDMITAVSHDLPVKLVVFDNGRLGMVKLEQEQAGLPEFGTVLANPDFAAVAMALGMAARRVSQPSDLEAAITTMLDHPGPYLLDVLTNPEEIALPPKTTPSDVWGFALGKLKESLTSRGDG
jgi:pyruvate dehydrogenase (quinone)